MPDIKVTVEHDFLSERLKRLGWLCALVVAGLVLIGIMNLVAYRAGHEGGWDAWWPLAILVLGGPTMLVLGVVLAVAGNRIEWYRIEVDYLGKIAKVPTLYSVISLNPPGWRREEMGIGRSKRSSRWAV